MFEIGDRVEVVRAPGMIDREIGRVFVIAKIGKNIRNKTLYMPEGSIVGWQEEQLKYVDEFWFEKEKKIDEKGIKDIPHSEIVYLLENG